PIYWPGKFNTNKQKLFFFFSAEYLPNEAPNSIRNYTVPTEAERAGDFSHSFKSCPTAALANPSTAAGCSLYTVKDPTTGAAFANNIIPASRIYANSAKLLRVFPLPNATNTVVTKLGYNFQIAGSEKIPVLQE